MKIFLDVGAYKGETIKIAMEYDFDKLYCFEPLPENCEQIEKLADHRVEIFTFGLWDKTKEKRLYNPKSLGASLFKDKNRVKDSTVIQVVRASDWFREFIDGEDEVYLKLNCEGAEWTILDDLIKSGEYKKIKVLMVDFDIRKIPSQKHLVEGMKERLKTLSIPKVYFADEYENKKGVHDEYTHYWLTNSI